MWKGHTPSCHPPSFLPPPPPPSSFSSSPSSFALCRFLGPHSLVFWVCFLLLVAFLSSFPALHQDCCGGDTRRAETHLPALLLLPLLLLCIAYQVPTHWFSGVPRHFRYFSLRFRLSSKNVPSCSSSPPCQAPSSLPLPTAKRSSPPHQEITAANTMHTDVPHSILLDYGLREDMVYTQG